MNSAGTSPQKFVRTVNICALSSDLTLHRFSFWAALICTLAVMALGICPPRFSPDSWAYLELSHSIFDDFYRVNTVRQFELQPLYGSSFPPLWPVVIALGRALFDFGIYTGYWLNGVVCVALLLAIRELFRALELPAWPSAGVYLAILGFPPFLDEVLAARSMPLSLTLSVGALAIGVRDNLSFKRVCVAGFLMGLNALTRFDALPIALLFGIMLLFRVWKEDRGIMTIVFAASIYFIIVCATLAPWMAYCLSHFEKAFISDNTRQLFMAKAGHAIDFYKNPPPNQLISDTNVWLTGLLTDKAPLWARGLAKAVTWSALPTLIAVVLVAIRPPILCSRQLKRYSWFIAFILPTILLPAAAVGYGDTRYFTGMLLLTYVLLVAVLLSGLPNAWTEYRARALLIVAALPIGVALAAFTARTGFSAANSSFHLAPLSATPEMQAIASAVQKDARDRPYRILDADLSRLRPAAFGALTGEPTSLRPDFPDDGFEAFVKRYSITHIYDPEGTLTEKMDARIKWAPLEIPGLFRLQLANME